MRSLVFIVATLCLLSPSAKAQAATTSIDLRPDGYPPAPCDSMTQDTGRFPKRHVEFLDTKHLLVSFALRKGEQCDKAGMPFPLKFRSVVLELSGKKVSSLDWTRPEILEVQSGPDGNVLEIVPTGIRLLDQSFHPLQEIPLPENDLPKTMSTSGLSIQLAPSRHGFAAIFPEFSGIEFKGYSAYFEGTTNMRPTISRNTETVVVGDQALVPVSGPHGVVSTPKSIELRTKLYSCPYAYWIALPTADRPVCLTTGYRLVELAAGGAQSAITDLRSMAPGDNSGIGYLLSDANSQRILVYSYGAHFSITQSRGYFKVAVIDLRSKQQILREGFPGKSDVAMSPDGKQVVVLEKSHLLIYLLP